MYSMYLVGYQKAMAYHKLTKQQQQQQQQQSEDIDNTSNDNNTNDDQDSKTKMIRQYQTDTESEIVNLKIELISDIFLWCDNYFYTTHQQCSMEFRGVSVIDSLKDLLNVHEYLSQYGNSAGAGPGWHQGNSKPIETVFNHDITYEVS